MVYLFTYFCTFGWFSLQFLICFIWLHCYHNANTCFSSCVSMSTDEYLPFVQIPLHFVSVLCLCCIFTLHIFWYHVAQLCCLLNWPITIICVLLVILQSKRSFCATRFELLCVFRLGNEMLYFICLLCYEFEFSDCMMMYFVVLSFASVSFFMCRCLQLVACVSLFLV